ncbi:hypothetical protein ACFL5O_05485 [Myxococcota bacterium]
MTEITLESAEAGAVGPILTQQNAAFSGPEWAKDWATRSVGQLPGLRLPRRAPGLPILIADRIGNPCRTE